MLSLLSPAVILHFYQLSYSYLSSVIFGRAPAAGLVGLGPFPAQPTPAMRPGAAAQPQRSRCSCSTASWHRCALVMDGCDDQFELCHHISLISINIDWYSLLCYHYHPCVRNQLAAHVSYNQANLPPKPTCCLYILQSNHAPPKQQPTALCIMQTPTTLRRNSNRLLSV